MNGQTIIDTMLKKAEEAEACGDKARSAYWMARAIEVEEKLKKGESINETS